MGVKLVLHYLNWFIIQLLIVVRTVIHIYSQEDEYHIHKKDGPCFMYINITTHNKMEYDGILQKLIDDDLTPLLSRYLLTIEEVLGGTSNILRVQQKYPMLRIGVNHYHVGGTEYLDLLLRIYGSKPVKWPNTDFIKAIYAIPSYLRIKPYLKPRNFPTLDEDVSYTSSYTEVVPEYKRAHVTHRLLSDIYTSVEMDRPMVAFVTMAFTHSEGINNNVGGFFIIYEPTDEVRDIHRKIRENGAQCYLTNSILHFPAKRSNSNFRRRIDCILTMGHVYSEANFELNLQLYDTPEEQVYCSCLTVIRPDDTIKYFMRYVTASANFVPTPDMKLVEKPTKANEAEDTS